MKSSLRCTLCILVAVLCTEIPLYAQPYDCAAQGEVPQIECEALVALYNTTGGDSWTNTTNWITGAISTWHGITVSGGHITQVIISNNNLTGTIPPEFGNLSALRVLWLFTNQLTGEIPPELGNLTSLVQLSLFRNQLTGEIPPELGNLTNLGRLELQTNQLTGEIPPELGNLTNLERLDLASNQLSGTIPAGFNQLTRLSILSLFDNQFAGPFPEVILGLPIIVLNLSFNSFTGPLPAEIGQLAGLEVLQLDGNQLSGSIPSEVGTLSDLRFLRLRGNQLSGEIPAALGDLNILEILFLDNNQLTGTVPDELGNLISLTQFDVAGNPLEGTLPTSLTSLSNITFFSIANTQLCASGDAGFQTWLQSIQTVQPDPVPTCTPTAVEDTNEFPTTYTLAQNYPNPFNPTTTIRYALPETATIRLVVYDMTGRERAVLREGTQPAGWHEVTFEARHLPAGVYLYRLTVGATVEVRTLTLLK